MRITAGSCRGRVLAVPGGMAVRPTADKVRQAIFNSLLQYAMPDGAQVLDMFAGTGALGLEALSRGAQFCTFIDNDPVSLKFCRMNIAALGMEACSKAFKQDATKIGARALNFLPASLVFVDPPYRRDLALTALMAAVRHGWIAAGAICVIEAEKEAEIFVPSVMTLLTRKKYGDTQVVFCRNGPTEAAYGAGSDDSAPE